MASKSKEWGIVVTTYLDSVGQHVFCSQNRLAKSFILPTRSEVERLPPAVFVEVRDQIVEAASAKHQQLRDEYVRSLGADLLIYFVDLSTHHIAHKSVQFSTAVLIFMMVIEK